MAARKMKRSFPLDIRAAVRSWLVKDDAVKMLGTQKEEERKLLLSFLQEHGVKDSDGHYWIRWPEDPVEGRVKAIKAEKHVRKVLDPEKTEEYLKRRKLWSKCTTTVTTLDEYKFLALVYENVISDEDAEALYNVTETYNFVPQRVKL